MKKEKGWRKIRATAVVIILAAILVNAFPVQVAAAAAEEAEAVKDFSADFVYRAMGDAIDNLWEGEAPRRSDIKIISKLPTPAAEQVIQVIIGQSEGDAPPEWISEKPGKYEINAPEGTGEKDLKAENFEFTFVNMRSGKEYVWKAEEETPDIFPAGYFELRNKKAKSETLKWYEESRLGDMESKVSSKLTESIGKRLSNELHDDYAHHLDVLIVGKVGDEGTMLCLAAELTESGDKGKLEALREKSEEASECIGEMHELIHGAMVPIAEEMGKGEVEAAMLHDLSHKLMGSIYRTGGYIDEIEKINDADRVKEKGSKMLEELKKLKEFSSDVHIHSTDLATVITEQKPLKLKNGRESVEIKHSDLTTYLSQSGGKQGEGQAPIGGAISFVIIIVGIIAVVIVRYRRR
jgi:signal transduction histidine kinase